MIDAAGGLVWRTKKRDRIEILLIHRPRYDDWSLPKGKRRRGETMFDCAVREVGEETGLQCDVGPELATVSYQDRKGRSKRVRYWAMQERGGKFRVNDEVDEVRWVRLDRAESELSYAHDVPVVASLQSAVATSQ